MQSLIQKQAISRKERSLFFWITLSGLLLRVVNLVDSLIFAPKASGTNFGIYDIFDIKEMMSPLYSFVVFAICTPLAWRVNQLKSVSSLVVLFLLAWFFDSWMIDSRQRIAIAAIENPDYHFKMFDFALLEGSIYDLVTLILVNILLIWQISILYRLSRRTYR